MEQTLLKCQINLQDKSQESDIQDYDAELSAIAALATTDSNFIVGRWY
jgi:hypothetical protein